MSGWQTLLLPLSRAVFRDEFRYQVGKRRNSPPTGVLLRDTVPDSVPHLTRSLFNDFSAVGPKEFPGVDTSHELIMFPTYSNSPGRVG